jgi:hypothetical protein
VLVLGARVNVGWIDESEFKCETALSPVEACCPGFDPTSYRCINEGCGAGVEPDLSIADADCIRQKSCDDLKAEGYCDAPRLGSPTATPTQCTQALTLLGSCCGADFADRWQCAATNQCGLPPAGSTQLPYDVVECAHQASFTADPCDTVRDRGLCDNLERPSCN